MVQGNALRSIGLILALGYGHTGNALAGSPQGQTYVTWGVFEPDKCASIWLIKRHIDSDARFAFFERDQEPPPGIAFDTPDARFRRYHNKSTYETLMDHHGLADERLVYMGRIMHDIEVNVWERKVLEETRRIEGEILSILSDEDPQQTVDACIAFFDRLYSSI
jgi:hypothetical protein